MKISRRGVLAAGVAMGALPCVAALGDEVPDTKMPKDGLIILAQLKAMPGEEEVVKAALVAMLEPTRKEEGCICYNLHQSKSDKSQFMFYEQWASKPALDAHGKTAHMKAMQQGIKGRIEKGGATSYEMIG